MDFQYIITVFPWAFAGVAGTIAWQAYTRRDDKKQKTEAETAAEAGNMERHRDDLLLKLIKQVTEENKVAFAELDVVREENRALRALEQHFYNFKQAMEHLRDLLTADAENRPLAERRAQAFIDRMERMQAAKGDIQQSIQVLESGARVSQREDKGEA